jgi:endogenous inhibitor of DNA gyrase (YacG/DUF329 family)
MSPANDDPAPARPCPTCGKPATKEFRPFCSKRCADVDLNRWLKGSYAIPVVEDEDEDGLAANENGKPRD